MADSQEQASPHEGHTHSWPKSIKRAAQYTCRDCKQVVDGALILDDREAAK